MISNRKWTPEEKARLTALLEEGSQVLTDVQALKDGLKDTVTTVSEELDIPKRSLNKAIRTHFKRNLEEDKEMINEVEEIISATGKIL